MKRKAPQKNCPSCSTLTHARTSTCKKCKHVFYVKKSVQAVLLAKNWRDLRRGDVIKVISGSGPYYLSKDNPGEKIMMGQKGKFEVAEIHDGGSKCCGIFAHKLYGRSGRSNYREWIYMGEPHYNDAYSLNKEPHRIRVIKKI